MTPPSLLFHQVVLRICGDLRIDKSLGATFELLRRELPVDRIYLEHLEVGPSGQAGMRIVAEATANGAQPRNDAVAFPEELASQMKAHGQSVPTAWIDNGGRHLGSVAMFDYLGIPQGSSLLLLTLRDEGRQVVGSVPFIAESGTFTEAHRRFVEELHDPFRIALSNARRHREVLALKARLHDDIAFLRQELEGSTELIGADGDLAPVMHHLQRVAATESTVLIQGETGTGKDVLASALHRASRRRRGPFVALNCGAIAPGLLDSELFGHEKGAFTGASHLHRGRFERAHGGTLFLDEVGELPAAAQVRLLRALQNREIERVGGDRSIPIDVRIIAATHEDLEAKVAEGSFRQDLYFRLAVFPLKVPPLRERPGDLPKLVKHFLRKGSAGSMPALTSNSMGALASYPWPGNVRELSHVIERALLLHDGGPLDLGAQLPTATATVAAQATDAPLASLDDAIREHLRRALGHCRGQIHGPKGAAALLKVNPSTLRSRIRKLGIDVGAFRG